LPAVLNSAFAGFRFPPEIIVLAVCGTGSLTATWRSFWPSVEAE
jgi:hypothetical protein